MKIYFDDYLITQNDNNGIILLFKILDNGKYSKRFRCDPPKNKHLTRDELLHLGKYIVRYTLPIGKIISVFAEKEEKKSKNNNRKKSGGAS